MTNEASATGVRFIYSTNGGSTQSAVAAVSQSIASASLTGLTASTEYRIYAEATSTAGATVQSTATTFTTSTASTTTPLTDHTAWYELPAKNSSDGSNMWTNTFYADGARNYTTYYDKSTYTAYWVAYPMVSSYIGGSRSGSWKQTPGLTTNDQINIWSSSYGVNYGSTSSDGYVSSGEIYARGHQIPDGDRSNTDAMQSQTYYACNSTPQIQNAFNGSIWSNLETAVRGTIPASDTLYVVTGAILRTVGGNETVTQILPKNESTKKCPVPNYYYKVLLKVKRNNNNVVTSASAIGFWMPHEPLKSASYTNYVTSVSEIETKTGFTFFANLPAEIRSSIRESVDWSSFQTF